MLIACTLVGSGAIPLLEKTSLKKVTSALAKCEPGISKLLEYYCKSFVMIGLCLAKNNDIIAYVYCYPNHMLWYS